MLRSLSIVGAGRVGRALGRMLRERGWRIQVVTAQSPASARKAARYIGAGRAESSLTAHLFSGATILLSVPDDAIPAVVSELARVGAQSLRGKIVLHTSGTLPSSVLSPLRDAAAAIGSIHPLQTFSGLTLPSLEGRVFGIEGDPAAVKEARKMARSLGGVPVTVQPSKKSLYHAAGVFAAGHVLALEEAGVQLLMSAGMTRAEASRALLALSRQVLDNYEKLGPQQAWTGPLSRGDFRIVASHELALRDSRPEFLEAYQAVSRLSARVLSQDEARASERLAALAHDLSKVLSAKGESA